MLQSALRDYAQANGGQLPADLSQLKPYFQAPVDDALLQRYALLQTGKLSDLPSDAIVVAEIAPSADEDYDMFYQFRMNGDRRAGSANPDRSLLLAATKEFAKANN